MGQKPFTLNDFGWSTPSSAEVLFEASSFLFLFLSLFVFSFSFFFFFFCKGRTGSGGGGEGGSAGEGRGGVVEGKQTMFTRQL